MATRKTAERTQTTTRRKKSTQSTGEKSQQRKQATKTRETKTEQRPEFTKTQPKEVTTIGLTNTGSDWGWEARAADGSVVQSSQMPHYNRHRAWNEARKMFPNATLDSD